MTDCKNYKYTDEYCASGDCNKTQANDLACNKISLTEKWKKGELPNGYYWIRLSWGGMVIMAYHTAFDGLFELDDHYYDSDEISEVLAPVPSYEEWQAKLEENAQLKEQINKCYLDAINRGTANAVKAVKEFGMPERIKELVEENAQLKELLKEWVQFEIEENPNDFTVMSERMSELANKTNEALK